MEEEALYALALENTNRLFPPMISTIGEVLGEMELPGMPKMEDNILLCIHNRPNQYGSSGMLFESILQQLAERLGGNFYILPSSTHELLAVPADKCRLEEYRMMVKEVNVSAGLAGTESYLSDEVYLYNAETGELSIA